MGFPPFPAFPRLRFETLRTTRLQAELPVVDLPISAVRGHQFVMRAALHNAAMLKHEDQIGIFHR